MPTLFLWVDPFLIRLYRLTGHAYADFFLGTLALACLAVILGAATTALAQRLIGRQVRGTATEAGKYERLSLEALEAGDRPTYLAANKLANEAYGKSFFQQLALSAAFFWPAFFALAWMSFRFGEIELPIPFTGWNVGYLGVFLILYVAAYLAWKRVKSRRNGRPPEAGDLAAASGALREPEK